MEPHNISENKTSYLNQNKKDTLNFSFTYEEIQEIYSDKTFFKILNVSNSRNYLWHIAMPKSRTTWLSSIISEIFKVRGGITAKLVPDYAQRPQEIDPRLFITPPGRDIFFTQQHCLYSRYTELLVKITGTKMIFQYRNIPDALISLRDHIDDALFGSKIEKHAMPKATWKLERENITDYILDVELPWYCKFLDGWLSSDLFNSNYFFALRYEDLIAAPKETVMALSQYLSLNFQEKEIDEAINNAASRFTRKNKGVVGRGYSQLSEKQKQKIINVAKYFNIPDDLVV